MDVNPYESPWCVAEGDDPGDAAHPLAIDREIIWVAAVSLAIGIAVSAVVAILMVARALFLP